MGRGRRPADYDSLDQGAAGRLCHPFVKVRERVEIQGGGGYGCQLPCLVDQKCKCSQEHATQCGMTGGAVIDPNPGKAKHSDRQEQNPD